MEFFKIRKDIPFMRPALVFNVISLATFLLAVFFLATRGLNLGVDFTGGTVMEVNYPQPADLTKVRTALAGLGYRDVPVQNYGTSMDVIIRLPAKQAGGGSELSTTIGAALREVDPGAEIRRVEFVGPQVGKELLDSGGLALLFVSLGIVLYLWFRFEWKFGVGGIVGHPPD